MKRVLVFGDAIADVYSEYAFRKMCPDQPKVPVNTFIRGELRPGGAANVAANLAILAPGVQVDLISLMDNDLARATKQASQSRVSLDHCVWSGPVRKERVYLDGVFTTRLDNRQAYHPAEADALATELIAYLQRHDPDLVVLSDYGHGCLSDYILHLLPRDILMVDTKAKDLSLFDGSLVIKLNQGELREIMQADALPESHSKALVTTLGRDGAVMHVRLPHPTRPTISVTHTLTVRAWTPDADVVDVCGCGDTFLAGMAASLLSNDDLYTAVQFGNAAAATVVTQPRTAVADFSKTMQLLGRKEQ